MLRDSVAVVRTRPRAIPLPMHDNHEKINSWVSFSLYGYGAPLGGPSGRRSSVINDLTKPNKLCILTQI